jgi:hypothetical protein
VPRDSKPTDDVSVNEPVTLECALSEAARSARLGILLQNGWILNFESL